jgi:hypothetical protein
MFRRALAVVTGTMTMMGLTVVAAPAAHASMAAKVAFECHAYFDSMPTASGSGVCRDGAVRAEAEVTAAGVADDGSPYVVEGTGPAAAQFQHSETCLAGEPPILVNAWGVARVTGLTAIHGGELTSASLDVAFLANGAGPKLKIIVTGATLTFANGGTASGTGAGEATYAPILEADNVCPIGGPLQAVVEGELELSGV